MRLAAVIDVLYARYRRRYAAIALVVTASVIGAVVIVGAWTFTRYAGAGSARRGSLIGVILAAAAVGLLAACLRLRSAAMPVRAWLADGPDAGAAALVWHRAVALPRHAVRVLARWTLPPALVAAVLYSALEVDGSVDAIVAAGLLVLLAATYLAVVLRLAYAALVRPLLEESTAELPQGFRVAAEDRLARELGGALVVSTALCGFITAGAAGDPGAGEGGLVRTVIVAIVVSFTIVFPLPLLFAERIIGPVRSLTDRIGRVASGDLSVRAEVLSRDEVGDLAASLNTMIGALRESADALVASRARIVRTADDERRRLERDLHDGAQQRLIVIGMSLDALRRRVADDPGASARAAELNETLDRALARLRELAHGIHPVALEHGGLRAALCAATAGSATPEHIECDGIGRYSPELEAAVYFCCQEAVRNARRHGGTRGTVRVSISERDGALEFAITDDGVGFDREAQGDGGALQDMADRIGALGGTLRVVSSPGSGMTVVGVVAASRVGA